LIACATPADATSPEWEIETIPAAVMSKGVYSVTLHVLFYLRLIYTFLFLRSRPTGVVFSHMEL
jgi:hypothetical protein